MKPSTLSSGPAPSWYARSARSTISRGCSRPRLIVAESTECDIQRSPASIASSCGPKPSQSVLDEPLQGVHRLGAGGGHDPRPVLADERDPVVLTQRSRSSRTCGVDLVLGRPPRLRRARRLGEGADPARRRLPVVLVEVPPAALGLAVASSRTPWRRRAPGRSPRAAAGARPRRCAHAPNCASVTAKPRAGRTSTSPWDASERTNSLAGREVGSHTLRRSPAGSTCRASRYVSALTRSARSPVRRRGAAAPTGAGGPWPGGTGAGGRPPGTRPAARPVRAGRGSVVPAGRRTANAGRPAPSSARPRSPRQADRGTGGRPLGAW